MADVMFDGIRVTPADDIGEGGEWNSIGSTADTTEPDYFYQGGTCISCQVKTAEVGMYYTDLVTIDYTTTVAKIWMAKIIQTNKDAIDGTGLQLAIGSSTGDYANYYIYSALTYPIAGGWQIVPIDPHVPGYVNAVVGTPDTASVNYYAIRSDASLTAKAPNLGIDAIDWVPHGQGLSMSGSSGVFQDFIDYDEGTSINRYGVVSTREGILYVAGMLSIETSSVITQFNDSNVTVVFPGGRFNTGFSGITTNLFASSSATMSACAFIGKGEPAADSALADTRPIFVVSGTIGTGSLTDGCSFTNFNQFRLNSKTTMEACVFNNPQQMTQSSAVLNGCTFNDPTTIPSGAFINSNNMAAITNCDFSATSSGHAIEITTAATYSFSGNTFTGYDGTTGTNLVPDSGAEDAVLYNGSGGDVTINIAGNGDSPSVRNGPTATTTINNPKFLTLTGMVSGTEVTIVSGSPPTVLFHEESINPDSGSIEYAYNYSPDVIVDILIFEVTKNPQVSNLFDYTLLNEDATIPIQQIDDNIYFNPGGEGA